LEVDRYHFAARFFRFLSCSLLDFLRVGFGSASPPPDRAFAATFLLGALGVGWNVLLPLDPLRDRNAEGFSFGFKLLRPWPATGSRPWTEAAWTIRGRMTASLLHFLSGGLLRPLAKRRIEDAMLSADLWSAT